MMVFTHILVGMALAAIVSSLFTANPNSLVIAGIVGGGFPDIDMLWNHRKTLHFPVVYSVISIILSVIYIFLGSITIILLLLAFSAAALHCMMDILGGGKEMRPWREMDNRAVYNHVSGEWIPPLRVFYDGSISDLVLAILLAIIAGLILSRKLWPLIIGLVLLSILYTLLRRAVTRWIPEEYSTFSSYMQDSLTNNSK